MKELAVMADESTAQGDGQGSGDGASAADTSTAADQTAESGTNNRSDVPPEVRRALTKANKEAEGLRRQLKEIEDRDKSESQKATERAEAAERAANDANSKLLRYQVAADKKLPASLAERLQGSTLEELAADADNLLKLLPTASTAAPSFDGGARTTAAAPQDMNSLIRHARRG